MSACLPALPALPIVRHHSFCFEYFMAQLLHSRTKVAELFLFSCFEICLKRGRGRERSETSQARAPPTLSGKLHANAEPGHWALVFHLRSFCYLNLRKVEISIFDPLVRGTISWVLLPTLPLDLPPGPSDTGLDLLLGSFCSQSGQAWTLF